MADTFLDMAADSSVPVLSGTHSIVPGFYSLWGNQEMEM